MQQNCVKCGGIIGEGKKFCPICGAKVESDPTPRPITLTLTDQPEADQVDKKDIDGQKAQADAPMPPPAPGGPAQVRTPPPAYDRPNYMNIPSADPDPKPSKDSKYAPVSIIIYMLLMVGMAIPFIGFILAIIFSFAGKSVSRKNFCRAVLIFMIIGMVLSIIAIVIAVYLIGPVVTAFIDGFWEFINEISQTVEVVPGI